MGENHKRHLCCNSCQRPHYRHNYMGRHKSHQMCYRLARGGEGTVCSFQSGTCQCHKSYRLYRIARPDYSSPPICQYTDDFHGYGHRSRRCYRPYRQRMRLHSKCLGRSPFWYWNSLLVCYTSEPPLGRTYVELPQVQVSALQHWATMPRHVALLLGGPQRPSVALKGSMTAHTISIG
jgi:hypothetical protein